MLTAILFLSFLLGPQERGISSTNAASKLPACIAPVEQSRFTSLTSYDSLQAFLLRVGKAPHIRVATLATTREGRTVSVVRVSGRVPGIAGKPKLKVLLFAQQHGDEPSGKEALTLLLAKAASPGLDAIAREVDLLIVPQMNPDGAERRQRRSADTLDLNRSHVLLNAPEVKGLHDLFLAEMPEVTLDIHEFGPYSSSWIKSGFIKAADVQLGMLTNLNSPARLRQYQRDRVFGFIADAMREKGYLLGEYIVGSPQDRIRHSTTEINDGRQSFGILGTLSFIQEGKSGKELEDRLERRARSQLASVEALLECCARNAAEIRALVSGERHRLAHLSGDSVVLRMEHVPGSRALTIPVRRVDTNRDTMWNVQPYHSVVRPLVTTPLPPAYLVVREDSAVVALLRAHQVQTEPVRAPRSTKAEAFRVDSIVYDVLEEDSLPRPTGRWLVESRIVRPGDILVPTRQLHSLFLATVLEPESMWGISKYPRFHALVPGTVFPIRRLP
jgi:hypothetical protein